MSMILVTGNTGYIGTVMVKRLREEGYTVTGLDCGWFRQNLFYDVPDSWQPDRQIIKDIRQIDAEDLQGIDAVIHLAALSNDPLGELNPDLTEEINFHATVKTARLCKEKGVERFIFASSCSIYGIAQGQAPITEEGQLNPLTAYAKSKVQSENMLRQLADKDFHPILMRNATVYGLSPRFRLDLVVNNLLAWAFLKDEIVIISDGTPWRPIIHIEDFCSAFITALKAPTESIHNEALNVGINEENYSVKEIAYVVKEFFPKSNIIIRNQTGPDERSYRVDFSKIKKILPEFKTEWNLRKGIKDLKAAYLKCYLSLDDFESDRYCRIRAVKSLIETGKIDHNLFLTGGKQ